MSATVEQIQRLRRMVNESANTSPYTDSELAAYIERYPLMDELGQLPYEWNFLTTPPSKTDNDSWVATYDLNSAAAELWGEKAAVLAQDYDFTADGGSYTRSQAYQQAQAMQRHYSSRRSASTIRLRPSPRPTDVDGEVN